MLLLLFAGGFTSCDEEAVFEQNQAITDGIWNADQRLSFPFQISDTISYHNFYLNLRNSGDYEYSNLYVFVHTYFPNGKSSKDTVECLLADPSGRWMGSGLGDLVEHQILFKYRRRFPLAGDYRIELEHAMRRDPLEGVVDAGIRIEKDASN